MNVLIDLNTLDGYRTFLKIKSLPVYRFTGQMAWFPDEYAALVSGGTASRPAAAYDPHPKLFDYQRDIAKLAIRKRKFAVFASCGLGKTLILTEYVRHVASVIPANRRVLIVSPLMVIGQTIKEYARFYGADRPVTQIRSRDLAAWMGGEGDGQIGITNYEAITDDLPSNNCLACIALDESSSLKSAYGKWGTRLIALGRGLDWKLCLTGTPAPNDRIEYANHAVFLDHYPTVNAFLARFFVNRGQTQERWELKPHALRPFYNALSHWCIFLSRPAVYGWKDNSAPLPPIRTHIIDVPLTDEQADMASKLGGSLFGVPKLGGIGTRGKWGRLAKGFDFDGKPIKTNKTKIVCDLAREATSIVWCKYNNEQDMLAELMPDAANITGATKDDDRITRIESFQSGQSNILISKPEILGYGLNLQVANRQVFSTVEDSWEKFHQAVKRSNRTGSKYPLDVFIPVTDFERPQLETVLTKAHRIEQDECEQEKLFKEIGHVEFN